MRIRFNISIVTAILLIITAMTLATIGSVWLVSSRTADETAGQLFDNATGIARERLDRLMAEVLMMASLGAAQHEMTEVTENGLDAPAFPILLTALEENKSLYSLYYGFSNGNFYQIISVNGEAGILKAHNAPLETQWIVRVISSSAPVGQKAPIKIQTWTFLNQARQQIGERREISPSYDPRRRAWYKNALDQDTSQLSAPYIFNSLGQPGITASRSLAGGKVVFGVDVTLTELSRFISGLDISEHGGVVVFDEKSRIVAMTLRFGEHAALAAMQDIQSQQIQAVERASQGQQVSGTQLIEIGQDMLMVQQMTWEKGGRKISIAAVAPMSDFVDHIYDMQKQILVLALLG
ncbi:MAG: cache domain-containing protein, partial [Magnetovibrio sp.]|nr:cache domain-containing protein [Magnetovibrio sp.]